MEGPKRAAGPVSSRSSPPVFCMSMRYDDVVEVQKLVAGSASSRRSLLVLVMSSKRSELPCQRQQAPDMASM